jgi:hypothetical protein
MSDGRQEVDALARALLERLDGVDPPSVRRLQLTQLNALARMLQLEAAGAYPLAASSGVVALVEECRDGVLREVDADGGLAVLQVEWQEVVLRAALRLANERSAAGGRCSRCGAQTVEVTYPGRRRRPPGRHFRRIGTTDLYRARRCSGCGLVQPPHGRPL